jgi:alpha-tubulin suppressor-like RCC1 family protein
MTTGSQNLNTQITTRLAASPTGLSCCQLEGARDILACASVVSVASVAALPDAAANQGRFFFVENICAYRFSDGFAWTDSTASQKIVIGSTLWTWGLNTYGRLGDGAGSGRCSSPGTTVGGGTNWCSVSFGYNNSAAVKTDGTLWTWGGGLDGRLGNGTVTDRSSPGQTCGLGANWCEASVGTNHTAALKTDGTLWTWGSNVCGRLGDGAVTARSSPGTTAGAGTDWCQSNAGWFNTAAVKTDGTLWTWGCNFCGTLGNGLVTNRSSPGTTAGGGTNWCGVSAGRGHTSAVKTDGTLWTWGSNDVGQLGAGLGTTVSRSSPGTTSGGGTTWCQSSSGCANTAGVKIDGTLWTWGTNLCGALGCGSITTTTYRISPVATFGGGTTWCKGSFGDKYGSAVKTDGTLWTWGFNNCGQLGDGTTSATLGKVCPGTTAGGGTTWCTVSRSAALKFSYKGFDQLP